MKYYSTMKKISGLIALLAVLTFNSCDIINGGDDKKPVDKFLVSYEMAKSYLPNFIGLVFDEFSDDYPEIETIAAKADRGVFIYRISYNTVLNDELVRASGLVCIPTGDGPFPILSYQNGTNTLHSNAPSVNPDNDLFLLLEFVASTGFVVVIPDYLGFGESSNMFHPYLHKESTVRTVLDMLRATRELANNYINVELSNELYISGYSQGGWATMQIQKEIEKSFLDEFNLKASACGAGPYDLNYINDYVLDLTNYPQPYFLAYMMNSYSNLGLTTPMDEIFNTEYAEKIPSLFDGTNSGIEINAELTTKVADLFTDDYYTNYANKEIYNALAEMLEENSVTGWNTEIPTLIIHGMEDDFVPREVSSNMYQSFLAAGSSIADVLWLPLPGLGHQTGIVPSGLASINWFLEMRESAE